MGTGCVSDVGHLGDHPLALRGHGHEVRVEPVSQHLSVGLVLGTDLLGPGMYPSGTASVHMGHDVTNASMLAN